MASSSSQGEFCYGPEDPSVLHLQKKHITRKVWAGHESVPFVVRRTESKVWDLPMHPRVRTLVEQFGFGGVLACGKPMEIDHELITALIERWRPETHTFHLPVGEATVTLEDVLALWGLRVDGDPFTGKDKTREGWSNLCLRLLGWTPAEDTERKKSAILISALINRVRQPLGDHHPAEVYLQRARIHVLILLGGLILPDTTGCKIPFMWLNLLDDVEAASNISWGSAALSCLYHYLCEGALDLRRELGGPMVLLQLWAWERMPTMRPGFITPPVHDSFAPCGAM